jgi:hypothetical protein
MSRLAPAAIRGFNYSGSWGMNGLDLWVHHDRAKMRVEVDRGVSYFPGWNAVRWWLSPDAFARYPERFLADFEDGLSVFAERGIAVMPVLFNRWRDPLCDFGGVYIDHFLMPGAPGATDPENYFTSRLHRPYLEAVVGAHRSDDRIYAWDLCNEPLGALTFYPDSPVVPAEMRWLTWLSTVTRAAGASQPLTVGNVMVPQALELTAPLCDVLSFHPYYVRDLHSDVAAFERELDACVDIAGRAGLDLIASETVWGSVSDAERIDILRVTLGALRERGIGFLVHALHHSLVSDMHSEEYAPVGWPGRMEFIEADGSLRPGHDAFNDYP